MDEPSKHAFVAVEAAKSAWDSTGLTNLMRDLVCEVWRTNLARYEPDELGDSARTLGFQCFENLSTRVERRIRGHELERTRWEVDGLRVSKPNGAIRMTVGGFDAYVMKAPMDAGRRPDWDGLVTWEDETNTRHAIATRNSMSLGGYLSPPRSQDALVPHVAPDRPVDSFLFVWTGEITTGLTAGWLTVPVLGEVPFAALAPLWWDQDGEAPRGIRPGTPRGPSFDEMPSAKPTLRLKPQAPPARGGA